MTLLPAPVALSSFRAGKLDPRLAHKRHAENVFVNGLHRALPDELADETVRAAVLPGLDDGARERFERHYHASPPGDRHSLAAPRLDARAAHLERIELANLFESIPAVPKAGVYAAQLDAPPTHAFFFEHPNEHVPGIMLLEAGRQLALACWHTFGAIPLDGFQFILHTFHSRFHDYVALNYPAAMRAEVLQLDHRDGRWFKALLRVSVLQRDALCVEMETHAQAIRQRHFVRLRGGRDDTDPASRFRLLDGASCQAALADPDASGYVDAELEDISLSGVRVRGRGPLDGDVGRRLYATLCFRDVGFVRSPCRLIWRHDRDETWQAGFQFEQMPAADRANLRRAIRTCCGLREDREHA